VPRNAWVSTSLESTLELVVVGVTHRDAQQDKALGEQRTSQYTVGTQVLLVGVGVVNFDWYASKLQRCYRLRAWMTKFLCRTPEQTWKVGVISLAVAVVPSTLQVDCENIPAADGPYTVRILR